MHPNAQQCSAVHYSLRPCTCFGVGPLCFPDCPLCFALFCSVLLCLSVAFPLQLPAFSSLLCLIRPNLPPKTHNSSTAIFLSSLPRSLNPRIPHALTCSSFHRQILSYIIHNLPSFWLYILFFPLHLALLSIFLASFIFYLLPASIPIGLSHYHVNIRYPPL